MRIWAKTQISIIFVTHNVREAVRLGQRVLLMSSRPGRIVREWPVEIEGERLESRRLGAVRGDHRAPSSGDPSPCRLKPARGAPTISPRSRRGSTRSLDTRTHASIGTRLRRTGPPVIAIAVVLLGWQLVAWSGPAAVRGPVAHRRVEHLHAAWSDGVQQAIWTSMSRGIIGFLAAIVVATPLGLLVARVASFARRSDRS